MVALLAQVIQLFRCIVSALIPSTAHLSSNLTTNQTVVQHLTIPLPQVLHKSLSQQFVDAFDEVLVIGDIHGCYDELVLLLNQISANNNNTNANDTNNNQKNKILKIFTGDLVNKGPKSKEVLEFLTTNTDSCLSVRGNHDEVVVREYMRYERDGESALKERNKWMKELTRKQIDYLMSLPYTISIPHLNALVVHAGIVPNVELNQQKPKDMLEMRNLVMSAETDSTTDEYTIKAVSDHKRGVAWAEKWSGPQHVYFGHDARRKLQRNSYSTGLDTGCVYGNALTAIFIEGQRKGTLVTVKATKVHCEPKKRTVTEE